MRLGIAIAAMLLGLFPAASALACTPMTPELYFQTSSEAVREGRSHTFELVDYLAAREDLSRLDLYGFTSVDLDADAASLLSDQRLEVVRTRLVEAGLAPEKINMTSMGSGGARQTTDPVLSNFVRVVPSFSRGGEIVDGCGRPTTLPSEGNS